MSAVVMTNKGTVIPNKPWPFYSRMWKVEGQVQGMIYRVLDKKHRPMRNTSSSPTEKKGFVISTKSFVKIGITKIFCYNKMFSSIKENVWLLQQNFWLRQQKIHLLSLILLP